jgi:demethylmenaquinone methyltransferase/2-methoxy-6-polyprenyl-1,4-benzoquinol methylase
VTRAALDKKPAEVAAMFDAVAKRYDVTNTVLSLGQDRLWRLATRRALNPHPGERVLDLAAGTAVSSTPLAKAGAHVTAADFSLGMLGAATRRTGVDLVAADGLTLPFKTAAFDAATISFGLRNVADPSRCLRELRRVVRPGGRLVVCEFSQPVWRPFRIAYVEYLMRALPAAARAVSSSPDAYVYLAESIRAWPDQAGLGALIQQAGWADVSWRNLTGGIVALHRAAHPAAHHATAPPA